MEKIDQYSWDRYLKLMKERPTLFTPSEFLQIITDKKTVQDFIKQSGKKIGVIYESPYSLLVVDLVLDQIGNMFTYERLVPKNLGAIICVPRYNNKFVLLKQYRHSIRDVQYAFPRGFGESGLSSEDNLKKEVREELDAEIINMTFLGQTVPDSGMLSSIVDVYCCNITVPKLKPGYEGIQQLCLVDASGFEQMIRSGEINDSFTLSAYALYLSRSKD